MTDQPINSNVVVAMIGLFGAIGAAVIAYFGGKNSTIAQLQASINEGFKALNDANQREITELKGEVRQLKQYNHSLAACLRQHGIDLPKHEEVTVVFAPFPGDDHHG